MLFRVVVLEDSPMGTASEWLVNATSAAILEQLCTALGLNRGRGSYSVWPVEPHTLESFRGVMVEHVTYGEE